MRTCAKELDLVLFKFYREAFFKMMYLYTEPAKLEAAISHKTPKIACVFFFFPQKLHDFYLIILFE